ncbi:MAG: hypothetical protein M5U34_39585 [Chloroflexi bacterium]|nr:hypothetical protein [Chloroflexota bacterium]
MLLVDETAFLHVKGSLTVSNYSDFNQKTQEALAATSYIVINLANADFFRQFRHWLPGWFSQTSA